MEIIRIKCPNCGILLGVKEAPKNEDRILTCPNCKDKNKFRDYRRVVARPVDDETLIVSEVSESVRILVDEATSRQYTLKEGINLIGRMTYKTPPKADVPIVTEDRGISREHLYIQVMKGRDGHYHYYAYNASNVNPTYLNDQVLEDGDKVGLKEGDKIKISDTVLRIEERIIDVETDI